MAIITGIAYPLEILPNGNLKVSEDNDLIREHILSWLQTFKNERVEPDYGIKFYVGTTENRANIESEIRNELIREIPNVRFSVKVTLDDTGVLSINVTWESQLFISSPNVLQVLLNV